MSHSLGRQLRKPDGFHAPQQFLVSEDKCCFCSHKVWGDLSAAGLARVKSILQIAWNLEPINLPFPFLVFHKGETLTSLLMQSTRKTWADHKIPFWDWWFQNRTGNHQNWILIVMPIICSERCLSQRFQTLTPKVRQQNASQPSKAFSAQKTPAFVWVGSTTRKSHHT